MDPPETRYAKSGDIHIAYQVIGSGQLDLVWVYGAASNIELQWEFPEYARFVGRLASLCRLICFDKRGTGASDRGCGIATLEERIDDVRAVMDAAGSQRAALLGQSEGGPMSILFAATHPERIRALVLFGSFAYSITRS
jgi:pimeloyl-ACP methyl ester carboxylesterase